MMRVRRQPEAIPLPVFLLVLLGAAMAPGCAGDAATGPDIGPPAAVVVTPAQGSIGALGGTTTLTATLTDADGDVISGATFTWSSSDGAIATVNDGVVTAVTNGAVTITATAQGISGSASITVQQVAATVTTTPDSVRLFVGGSAQVTASVRDANANEVADASVTWSSSNNGIATVTAAGVVRAVAAGTATITATADGRTGTAAVIVAPRPPDFTPARDTMLSGTVNAGTVMIPAGVAVNVQGSLTLNVADSARIAGTLTGDCTALRLDAAAAVTITGGVTNECTNATASAPGLRITSGGAVRLLGAQLASTGGVTVSNEPALEAFARPLPVGDVAHALATARTAGHNCDLAGVLVRSAMAADGADGTPNGEDGAPGGTHTIVCGGNLNVIGPENSGIFGNHGGRGGTGTSMVSGTPGQGGKGGKGADIVIVVGGNFVIETFLLVAGGRSGAGGLGRAQAHPTAIANGGDAGPPGLPLIRLAGVFQGSGALDVEIGSAARGGDGDATGLKGKDATATEPAEAGGDAAARGGNASDYGGPGRVNLIGDLIQGNAAGANIRLGAIGLFPFGGAGQAKGGAGGNGSYEFPPGARGGNMTAQGGTGASVLVVDNRTGMRFLDVEPGLGGSAAFEGGVGGVGGNGCRKVPFKMGGMGGEGGSATGSGGDGGTKGANQADAGSVFLAMDAGDGGNGGPGAGPGVGGPAGADDLVLVKKDIRDDNPNFEDGDDGKPCRISFSASISVESDPNGHEPFIQATRISSFTIEGTSPGMITIRSADSRWVTVMGTIDQDGNFKTSGTGVVAGFSDVPVTFDGTVQTDSEGNVTGVSGRLTMDATNSVLPPDDSGTRNPAVYTVNGFSPFFQ